MAENKAKQNQADLKTKELEQKNKKISQKIEQMSLEIKANANDEGTLFSGITTKQIITNLNNKLGSEFKENNLIVTNPIKKIGEHDISVNINNNKYKLKLVIKNDK